MRAVSGRPVRHLWLLLFLLLRALTSHASVAGGALRQESDQTLDEGQGLIQAGEVARDGVDGDSLHERGVQDGVDDVFLHGRGVQDGVGEVPLQRSADQDGVNEVPLQKSADQDVVDEVLLHGKGVQDGVDEVPLHGRGVQDGVNEVLLHGSGVQDGVDEDSLHEKQTPRSRLNGLDGDVNVKSSRVDFPCPEAIDIEPCICTVDTEQNIDLDCSAVTSEEQLAAIFQKDFPVKSLRYFKMTENSYVRILDNILNGVTFQKIDLYPGPFALAAISDYFFLDCRETLEYVRIYNSELTSPFFPFATFEAMEKLDYVRIDGNSFTYIPKIIAPTVSKLYLYNGLVEVVESGTFPIREGPIDIQFNGNLIHTVEPGTFYFADESSSASNEELRISLMSNKLRSIQAGTFPLRNGPTIIWIFYNQLEVIEPGTFILPGDTTQLSLRLYLDNNQLTAFSEEVFGELMPYATYISLYANPLACNCSLAWIITNPEHLAKMDENTACEDGTKLVDLDPTYYIDLC